MTDPEQVRRLVTEIPGPRSRELAARRSAAMPAKMGSTMPVFAARAGGNTPVALISSRHTLERTPLTPGTRISFSIKKYDSDFRSSAATLST